jgi:hypothetical protein
MLDHVRTYYPPAPSLLLSPEAVISQVREVLALYVRAQDSIEPELVIARVRAAIDSPGAGTPSVVPNASRRSAELVEGLCDALTGPIDDAARTAALLVQIVLGEPAHEHA